MADTMEAPLLHQSNQEAGLTIPEIASLLTPFVGASRARQRAEWTHEDMSAVGFPIKLSGETPGGYWEHIKPQPEYVLPLNEFNINGDKRDNQLGGSFVTIGNLPRLAQCVEIARTRIPHLWPKEFARQLLGREHLNALNEIWWLKFWKGIESVNRGPKHNKALPDYEWRICCRDGLATCVINLEVKRRIGTLNQLFKRRQRKLSLTQVAKKFGQVPSGECNIVALTVYHRLSEASWRHGLRWLEKQEHVHGIIVWMEGSGKSDPIRKCIKDSHRWADFLILGPEAEDRLLAGVPFGVMGDPANPLDGIERLVKPSGIIVEQ